MTGPARYRLKPVIVEALQFNIHNLDEIAEFIGEMPPTDALGLSIVSVDGKMLAGPGDWILRDEHGELHPRKAAAFAELYELIDEDDEPVTMCEACGKVPAVHSDGEGVWLCQEDWDSMTELVGTPETDPEVIPTT